MIEPTEAQIAAAIEVFDSPGAENWRSLVAMAIRAAFNADVATVVIDAEGWAESAFEAQLRKVAH